MNIRLIALAALPLASTCAMAQFQIDWYTIDGGGGTSTGGTFSLSGTIGQPDAGGPMTGGTFSVTGGYWTGAPVSCHGACVADFDDGSGNGVPDGGVTIDDLLYYLSLFASGAICADIDDGSGTGTQDQGVTIDDLLYFLARFAAGC